MRLTRLQHVLSRIRTYANWPTLVWPFTKILSQERVLRIRNGARLYVRSIFGPDFTVAHEQFFRDDYGLAEIELSNNAIILDIGSNIGAFSILAAFQYRNKFPRIFAFEPDPANYSVLLKNIRLNLLSRGGIWARQNAVSDKTEQRMFYLSRDAYTHSLYAEQAGEIRGQMVVQCCTIEDILRQEKLEIIDLLKLDVEGSEYEILLNLPASVYEKIRNIVLEIHERPGYSRDDLISHICLRGYRVSASAGNSHVYTATKTQ